MTVALVTAVYDDYDQLRPFPAQTVAHEAICVTDNPDLSCDGWTVVYEPCEGVHPNRAAKTPKCCPWWYTDAERTVWVDASFRIQSAQFIEEMCTYKFGQFAHPDRDCIYDEAAVSAGMAKYAGEPFDEQLQCYRAQGHPAHWGLWAGGIIVRQWSPVIERFGDAWLNEIFGWSFQDQVSEAPMLRKYGLRPQTIPGSYRNNDLIRYEGSGRH